MTIRQTSVIICTHNRADMLPGVIGQLRAQEYPAEAFEIVVVDNDSTDTTPQVVRQLATEPGVVVRYIAEPRLGITFARNRGAREARYPYLAYLDDDCSVTPVWLARLVEGFNLHDEVAAVGGCVVLDWSQTVRPPWCGPELEPWLAGFGAPGTEPRLLGSQVRVIECNMALKREVWEATGGFLGMEQFGSRHIAASEVLHCLEQIERQGRRIAFAPAAVVHHHVGQRSRRWMISRGYWQGVSDGLLDHLIHRRSVFSVAGRAVLDTAAMLVLLGHTCIGYLGLHQDKGLAHLVRSMRRLGLVLTAMRLVGDWPRVRSWVALHPGITSRPPKLIETT